MAIKKVRCVEISHELITQFLIEGIDSIIPDENVPKDLQIVDCQYTYRTIKLFVCSESFDELKEGHEAPYWDLCFKRK